MDFKALLNAPKASDFQQAIYAHIAAQIVARVKGAPIRNLLVEATAGSGKTTTITTAMRLFRPDTIQVLAGTKKFFQVVCLAFNASIAKTLDARLKAEGIPAKGRTLNSLGFEIWRNYYRSVHRKQVQMAEGNKIRSIMRNSMTFQQREDFGDTVEKIVNRAMSSGLAPTEAAAKGVAQGVNGLTDTDENLLDLCETHDIMVDRLQRATIFRLVREILLADFNDEGSISFDDQKWFPVVKLTSSGAPIPCETLDAVMVDESQDLSPLDAALVKRVCRKNTIVVFVGDREQSLYAFRGADANSIDNLIQMFDAVTLPLSISYRCATSIVEEARNYSTRIEAFEGAPLGKVESLGSYTVGVFNPALNDKIVCRNNAPLVKMAFRLIANRVPCYMMGRDLGKNLISAIQQASGTKKGKEWSYAGKTTTDLVADLADWKAQQIKVILAKNPDNEAAVDSINDRYDTIMVFVDENKDGKIETVISEISTMFTVTTFGKEEAPTGKVVLSSVHRAKGLEAERVFILDRDLFEPAWVKKESQKIQERNIVFVAITRAKKELYYIATPNLVS